MRDRRRLWQWSWIVWTGIGAAGCAEAPFGLARLNPMLVEEWKKDEQYGPTFHTKMEELQALATAAPTLPPAEQQRLSAELQSMVRTEKNPLMIRQLVRTLAAFPTETSLDGLRLATEHSDPDVRVVACEGWRMKGGREGLEQLAKMLSSDTDVDVRIAAAREISAFKDPIAVQALGAALDDTNPALQHRAVQSLKLVTGRDMGDNVAAWREYVASGGAKPVESVSWTEQLRSFF